MAKGKFSKKARRHARESRARTQRMLREADAKSGPVKVSWLPGFEPPEEKPLASKTKTRIPLRATIDGRRAIVWDDWIEYEEEDPRDEFA